MATPAKLVFSVPRLALDFLVAALLLTPLDAFQVTAGILTGGPSLALAAVRFGLVGVGLGLVAPTLDPRPHPRGRRGIAANAALFVAAYVATVVLRDRGSTTTFAAIGALVTVGFAANAASGIRARELAPLALLLGIGGPIVEATGVALDLFRYTRPDVAGVPAWLPLLWTSGSFLARDLFTGRRAIWSRPTAA